MSVPLDRPILSPVHVGRAAELEAVERALDRLQEGAGHVLLIAGEAGIGKSRLVLDARQRAQQRGLPIFQGRCFEQDRALPYAPWLDLLRSCFAGRSAEELAQDLGPAARPLLALLPEMDDLLPGGVAAPPLGPEQGKQRLFHALAGFLAGQGAARPILVVIEDLHWSDEASLEFLLYLARQIAGRPILLLLTYRTDEPHPGLVHVLAELERRRVATELALRRLGPPQVEAMLRAIFALDRPVSSDFLDAIYSLTDGNPFFIEEVLTSLVAAGDVFHTGRMWDRRPLIELRIPRTVEDAVRRRVERLSGGARDTLVLAAVAGRRFDVTLLHGLTQLDEGEILRQLKELMAAHLIVHESADRFSFRHALTRQAIYAGLLERERRALHGQVAVAMERLSAAGPDALLEDLAGHFYSAGLLEKALDYARRAGERAVAMDAPRAAVAQFARAIEAAEALLQAPSPALLRERGRAYETLGAFEQARADLEAAVEAARKAADRRAEWQGLLDLGLLWASRDYGRSGAYIHEALELARTLGDPSLVARSLNRLGNWHFNRAEPSEAERCHEEALATFEALGDRRGMAETEDLLGLVAGQTGTAQQSLDHYGRAAALFRELDDRRGLASVLAMMAQVSAPAGDEVLVPAVPDLDQYVREGERAVQLAREIGWRAGEAFAWLSLAQCLGAQGLYARALEAARSGLALAEEIEHHNWRVHAHLSLTMLYRDLLALPPMREHAERALELARAVSSPYWVRIATVALAGIALVQGEPGRAAEVLDGAIGPDAERPIGPERTALGLRAAVVLAQGDATRALEIVGRLVGPTGQSVLHGPWRVQAAALTALGRSEEAEGVLLAAHEAAQRAGSAPLLWRTHVALGRFYQDQGRRTAAAGAFAAARGIIEQLATQVPDEPVPALGGISLRAYFLQAATDALPAVRPLTPLRAAKLAYQGLTAREREVAALIARGKSNREIAADLFIGERTVQTHISSIFAKLGCDSRARVAAWAVENRLLTDAD